MLYLITMEVINMAYIYSIVNLINNKAYIGQTIGPLTERMRKHLEKLRSNTHPNNHLQYSYNKYGEQNFQIILLCETTIEELDKMEILYIALFDTTNDKKGYNITSGGSGVISEKAQLKNKFSNQEKWPNILQINPITLKIEKTFAGINEAARNTNNSISHIWKSCNDMGRIVKGYYYIRENDYHANWKPHINTKKQPCCLLSENTIKHIFSGRKEAEKVIGLNSKLLNQKIKSNKKIKYNNEEYYIKSLTHEEYYKYSVGTCIDYPR